MSDQLPPRRRIEPLAPPPGEFDRVMNQARYRRHRRALAVLSVAFVFVAGIGGGLAMGRNVPQRVIDAATNVVSGEESEGASSSATANTAASRSPKDHHAKPTKAPTKLSNPSRGELGYQGQAIGPAGQPAANLYVYVGVPGKSGFVPAGDAIGLTASDGSFSMSCPGAPVLLAPWPINAEAKSKARNVAWGATYVGGATEAALAKKAPCTRDRDKVDVTYVARGSAVEGTVTMPEECKNERLGLWVWLHNNRALHVNVQDLEDGQTYRVSGLPPGEHTIGANGERYEFVVGGGKTTTKDVTFACDDDGSEPTSEPSTSAPTDTGSPEPTESPTDTHTGTTDPSPSQTPTP